MIFLNYSPVNSDLYYLMDTNDGNGGLELRVYDIANDVDSEVERFPAGRAWNAFDSGAGSEYLQARGTGGRTMFVFQGKLVFCVSYNGISPSIYKSELWEYDLTTLTRLIITDQTKEGIGAEASFDVSQGGAEHNNRLHFGNIIYDGEFVYSGVKNFNDVTNNLTCPMFSDGELLHYAGIRGNQQAEMMREINNTYRSTTDKNYLVFGEMEEVSTIQKLANSVTIIFDKFDTAEEIQVDYSTDGGDSWTELGSASNTLDGASVTQKTFLFGDDVTFRKIMFRVFLNGDGTSTPILRDISLNKSVFS